MSSIEDLHDAVFGFRPAKAGTANERLTALVLAVLGWAEVKHNQFDHAPGKRAEHQPDVTARRPDGVVRRMLVECKDWAETVGKGTLDTLVGVRSQLGAGAAAVVTTIRFTDGAIDVAVDEDVAMVLLKPYTPEDGRVFVTKIVNTIVMWAPVIEDVDLELAPDHGLASESFEFELNGWDHLRYRDGSEAEAIDEVLKSATPSPSEEGVYAKIIEFPGDRLLRARDGRDVPIVSLKWNERMVKGEHRFEVNMEGDPVLIVDQLNEHGNSESARLVIDRKLSAWTIDDEGNVVPRAPLG